MNVALPTTMNAMEDMIYSYNFCYRTIERGVVATSKSFDSFLNNHYYEIFNIRI